MSDGYVTSAEYAEIDRWKHLGVATFPGPRGKKGPRELHWPSLPYAAGWELSEAAAGRGPINLVVRTGATADGTKHLGAIDLDGKCPCGHDRAEHQDRHYACRHLPKKDEAACDCAAYQGVAPQVARERLLELLPPGVAVNRTARGFHLIFLVKYALPNGTLPTYSGEVFGGHDPHALQVPPSLHPSGVTYRWVREPGDDLPTVDLEALGLAPSEPLGAPCRASAGGRRRNPAPTAVQDEFEKLMAEAGVWPRKYREEFHRCPWHAESKGSLHVDWQATIFCCFGCREQGGLRRLRELVDSSLPPGCDPSSDLSGAVGEGLQLGGSRLRDERDRLADALEALGHRERSARMRQCREATWNAADGDATAFICPAGDAAPVRMTTRSCDHPQCPTCMPWRFASDVRRRWKPSAPLTLVRLHATELSAGLDDWSYLQRTRARFREYQRQRGLQGGVYAVTVRREGDCWRAELLVAVADIDSVHCTDGRAFQAQVIGRALSRDEVVRCWQQAYLSEAAAWEDLGELTAFQALTKNRRKFQGFGKRMDEADTEPPEEEEVDMAKDQHAQPLGRVAGGSGRSAMRSPCCPRCGERMKRIGAFDTRRMEMVVAQDGVAEWRWRTPPR